MRKFWSVVLSAVLLFSIFILPTNAEKTAVCNWYCVRRAGHLQPSCEPAMNFIERYNGYYIDKKHGDSCDEKVVYLTFDAGYENGNVEKILDVLKNKQVPAAFFVLSHLVSKNTALINRMFEEGHTVCNHTAHHKNMATVDRATFEKELNELSELCIGKTGKSMAKYYRPPEGSFNENNLKWAQELGYKTIFWSFAYADWDNQKQLSSEAAKQKILDKLNSLIVI